MLRERSQRKKVEGFQQDMAPVLAGLDAIRASGLIEIVKEEVRSGTLPSEEALRQQWESNPDAGLLVDALGGYTLGLETLGSREDKDTAVMAVRTGDALPPELAADPVFAETVRRMRVLLSIIRKRGQIPGPA